MQGRCSVPLRAACGVSRPPWRPLGRASGAVSDPPPAAFLAPRAPPGYRASSLPSACAWLLQQPRARSSSTRLAPRERYGRRRPTTLLSFCVPPAPAEEEIRFPASRVALHAPPRFRLVGTLCKRPAGPGLTGLRPAAFRPRRFSRPRRFQPPSTFRRRAPVTLLGFRPGKPREASSHRDRLGDRDDAHRRARGPEARHFAGAGNRNRGPEVARRGPDMPDRLRGIRLACAGQGPEPPSKALRSSVVGSAEPPRGGTGRPPLVRFDSRRPAAAGRARCASECRRSKDLVYPPRGGTGLSGLRHRRAIPTFQRGARRAVAG